jgi:hypothetical protein
MKVRESVRQGYSKTRSPGPLSRVVFRKLKIESEANTPLLSVLEKARKGVIVLTSRGRARYALVPVKDRDMESYALATHPTFLRLIERSRLSYARHGGIPLEEVARGFGIALAAVGRERALPGRPARAGGSKSPASN